MILQGEPALSDAFAALLVWQWARLEWPMPDRICTLSPLSFLGPKQIAQRSAELLSVGYQDELRMKWVGWLQSKPVRRGQDFLNGKTILIIDAGADHFFAKEAIKQLMAAEPQEIFLFSLFENPWGQNSGSDILYAKGGFYVDSSF